MYDTILSYTNSVVFKRYCSSVYSLQRSSFNQQIIRNRKGIKQHQIFKEIPSHLTGGNLKRGGLLCVHIAREQ